MKKLIIALGLAAALFAAPSAASAHDHSYRQKVVVVHTKAGPVYYQYRYHVPQKSHRHNAGWHKEHERRRDRQCRAEAPRRAIWYR